MEEPLTRKQRRARERQGGRSKPRNNGSLVLAGVLLVIVAVLVGMFVLGDSDGKPPAPAGDVVSQKGVHWDPKLDIYIKGQKQALPVNLGLTDGHNPIHTHEGDGMIHFEYPNGPATKDQLKLGAFFRLWNKAFNSEQILDSKNGLDGRVKMTVNGQPSYEFENYQIKEKDIIEIRFE